MIDYIEEFKKLRFNFRPEEILDYQTLLTLVMSVKQDANKYEEAKEEMFHTLQILVLVYGMEDTLNENGFVFKPEEIDLNDINLWQYLTVRIFNDLEKDSNFILSDSVYEEVLNVVGMLINTEETECSCNNNCNCNKTENVTSNENFVKTENDLNDLNSCYIKEYVTRENLLQYKCACCGLNEWQNKPLSLRLSHKNGNPRDNSLYNLEFLCPNCYSQIGK